MIGKRMKKLLMSIGYSRNFADLLKRAKIVDGNGSAIPNAATLNIFLFRRSE